MSEQSEGVVVQTTITSDGLEQMVRKDPLGVFLKYPFKELREKCLKVLEGRWSENYHWRFHLEFCERLETIIRELHADHYYRDYATRLLAMYFRAEKDKEYELRPAALVMEFYAKSHLEFETSDAVRLLITWVKSNASFYDKVPGLFELLANLLSDLYSDRYMSYHSIRQWNQGYRKQEWEAARRALVLINQVGDFRFLPGIRNLLYLLTTKRTDKDAQGRTLLSFKENGLYDQEQHIAILRAVERRLKKELKENPHKFAEAEAAVSAA